MTEATVPDTAPVPTPATMPTPASLPTPGSLPVPSSSPTPSSVPTPAALRPPAVKQGSDPSQFGRVTEDGTVYLNAPEGEVVVGQWAAGPPAEGLAFFGRKYDDLAVEIDLISRRLGDGKATGEQAQGVLAKVREALAARSFVGDVAALEARCDALDTAIATAKAAAQAQKAEQRARAAVAREALTVEAESLAGSTSWKATSERFASMIDDWKSLPHADRAGEQAMWKRISAARALFDKARRAHFAELDSERKVAVARKRELIAQAEALSISTDWAGTGRKLRDLMTAWKDAPRSSKQDEDKLWKRFKAAQDLFYAAKTAAETSQEDALKENVPAKEALVSEAEALLPVTDTSAAKRALRSISERWEKAGDLPRADRDRLERRLKKVEDAIRGSEAESWKRSNPETRARAESTANAFTDGIAKLEIKRAKALDKGDLAEVERIDASIASTRALLGAAEAAAAEFRG
jgi:hypothetical protein